MRRRLPAALAACAALGGSTAPAQIASDRDLGAAPPGAFDLAGGLRRHLRAPLVDRDDTGTVWVRTRDLRIAFDGAATTVHPVVGRSSPREWPVRLSLAGATIGGEALSLSAAGAPEVARRADGGVSVSVDRGTLVEVHHLDLHGCEQTFELACLPGQPRKPGQPGQPGASGDLVVSVAIETDLAIAHDAADGSLRFVHETYGHLDYGAAFVLDAAGRKLPIARTLDGGHVQLTVPAAFLAEAVLPITIDPLLSWFSSEFGISDDARPDVVYCGVTREYLVCWEEHTSAANSDVYLTKWDETVMTQGDSIALEMGNDTWTEPRIAYSYAADRALVVANVNPVPMGLPTGAVVGRLVDVSAFAPVGGGILVSTVGSTKHGVGVGGSDRAALAEANFCVVWSQEIGAGQHDVRYRVLAPGGALLTGVVTVDGSAHDDVTPAVAKTLGAGGAPDLAWTMVWIRDTDGDGIGSIHGLRIPYDGAPGGPSFVIDSVQTSANPVVSARFDSALDGSTDRPVIVAFERLTPSTLVPGALQGDIQLRVVRDGLIGPLNQLNVMEDFDVALDQRRPAICTNGRGFCVAYLEERYDDAGNGDWNVHMATGGLVVEAGVARAALGERHQILASTTLPETPVRLTMRSEGHPFELGDLGAAIWTRVFPGNAAGFGGVHGVTFRQRAALLVGPKPVGRQVCDALPNSRGLFGGRTSSWLRILGNQSSGTLHTAECIDMPANAFGYLLASRTEGNVLHPGGSQGRLCLSGDIGRYVDQIASSGGLARLEFTIDPGALPQPSGPVAALPGETWSFQVWHRDAVNGVATSNFSNACAVHFRN